MACRLGPVLPSQVHFVGGFLRVGCLEEYLCRRNDNLMWLPSPDLSSQIRDFSIDTIPRDPHNSQYIFVAVAALNTQRRS